MSKVHLQNLGEDITVKLNEKSESGKSAYQIAVDYGFVGTEREWLESLRGDDGQIGSDGQKGEDGNGFSIAKVYDSVIEMNSDSANPDISDGTFVIINSEDEDNGSLYVKDESSYKFQAKLAGVKGNTGSKGDRGRGVVVKGSKASEGDLPLTGLEGDAYWIGERLYIWSNDPKEIVEPGFVRGNSLKGSNGLDGSDANVTPANIKSALNYTPANQEIIDNHTSLNASKTVKGHMQVGDGLSVSNGVVSLQRSANAVFDNNTTSSQFPIGVTEIPVQTNTSSKYYTELRDVINTTIGYNIGDRLYYRFYVKVTKRTSTSVRQEVFVTSNMVDSTGHEMFKLQRETDYSSGNFNPWRVSVITMTGSGDPNSKLSAMRGCLYFDYASGKLYRKNTGITDAPSTGWAVIAG